MNCCCSLFCKEPQSLNWNRFWSEQPVASKIWLGASVVLGLALLILGSLALEGVHHPFSSLASFASAIGEPAAAAMITVGAIFIAIGLYQLYTIYRSYREYETKHRWSTQWNTRVDRLNLPLTASDSARLAALRRKEASGAKFEPAERLDFSELKVRERRRGTSLEST